MLTWLDLTWTLHLTLLHNTDIRAGHDLMHLTISPLIVCLKVNIQTSYYSKRKFYSIPYTIYAIAWQNQQNDLRAQRSLRSAWAFAQSDQRLHCVKDQTFIDADSEDSDQTVRMLRLIWVFAERTCNIFGFVKWRLIFVLISPKPQTFHCTSDNFSAIKYIR